MIFIVMDAVPNVPQTPKFFREAGHAQIMSIVDTEVNILEVGQDCLYLL
jgi:hypothetical protein